MKLSIRPATKEDFDTIVTLWNDASRWLHDQGEDQWQYPIKLPGIRAAIDGQTCWIVETDHGQPAATVTLDTYADPRLWRPDDLPDQALYVHRLVVRRPSAAPNLGSAILDWAGQKAATATKPWLRLDAWTSNERLRRYYLEHGFHLLRVVETPGVVSGALFQRPASRALDLGPDLRETGTYAHPADRA